METEDDTPTVFLLRHNGPGDFTFFGLRSAEYIPPGSVRVNSSLSCDGDHLELYAPADIDDAARQLGAELWRLSVEGEM